MAFYGIFFQLLSIFQRSSWHTIVHALHLITLKNIFIDLFLELIVAQRIFQLEQEALTYCTYTVCTINIMIIEYNLIELFINFYCIFLRLYILFIYLTTFNWN